MKIVIDISEDNYKLMQNGNYCGILSHEIYNAIKNGTPLPDIFDLEGLKSDMKALNCGFPYGLDYLLDCLEKRLGIKVNE